MLVFRVFIVSCVFVLVCSLCFLPLKSYHGNQLCLPAPLSLVKKMLRLFLLSWIIVLVLDNKVNMAVSISTMPVKIVIKTTF